MKIGQKDDKVEDKERGVYKERKGSWSVENEVSIGGILLLGTTTNLRWSSSSSFEFGVELVTRALRPGYSAIPGCAIVPDQVLATRRETRLGFSKV